MALSHDPTSTWRSIEYVDRAIETLEAAVVRMARRRHRRWRGAVAMGRTYQAERLIAVLRKQRAALEAGDRRRAEELDREFIALRSQGARSGRFSRIKTSSEVRRDVPA